MLNVDASDLKLDPFPHIVKPGLLDPSQFEALNRTFPGDQIFGRQATEWGGGRANLVRGLPLFEEFVRDEPAWREFYGYINSRDFVASMVEVFGDAATARGARLDTGRWHFSEYREPLYLSAAGPMTRSQYYLKRSGLDKRVNAIRQSLSGDRLYVTFDIARSRSGYEIPVHCDNRYKFLFMLLYFNSVTDDGGSGGDLLLHRHTRALADADYPRYPGEAMTEAVARVTPAPNLGVIGLNCNNSYHSATSLDMPHGHRRFVYIGICKRFCGSMWISNPTAEHAADARGVTQAPARA